MVENLVLLVFLSAVVWYIVDRFKGLWAKVPHGKYITMAVAAVLSFAVVFGYKLDLMAAAELIPETSILGQIITAIIMMSDSSAISEIIGKIKTGK